MVASYKKINKFNKRTAKSQGIEYIIFESEKECTAGGSTRMLTATNYLFILKNATRKLILRKRTCQKICSLVCNIPWGKE